MFLVAGERAAFVDAPSGAPTALGGGTLQVGDAEISTFDPALDELCEVDVFTPYWYACVWESATLPRADLAVTTGQACRAVIVAAGGDDLEVFAGARSIAAAAAADGRVVCALRLPGPGVYCARLSGSGLGAVRWWT